MTERTNYTFLRAARLLAVSLCLAATGCTTENAYEALTSPPDTESDADSLGTAGGSSSPDSTSVTLTAVTSDTGGGSLSTGGDSDGLDTEGMSTDTDINTATEGVADDPPEIFSVSLTPDPILSNGLITAEVSAVGSDGVRLTLESGATIELEETAPGTFVGAFPVLTGLENGAHIATFTSWFDVVDGEPVDAAYSVALQEPGAEFYFETGDLLLGKGWVDAVGMLPTGDLIELGTHLDEEDKPRCYLRHRNPDGGWGPQDVVELLPGQECKAVDLHIRDNGTIHALVSWKVNADEWSWWLSDIPQWGTNPLTMASGSPALPSFSWLQT